MFNFYPMNRQQPLIRTRVPYYGELAVWDLSSFLRPTTGGYYKFSYLNTWYSMTWAGEKEDD